jgi:hypothetical protein
MLRKKHVLLLLLLSGIGIPGAIHQGAPPSVPARSERDVFLADLSEEELLTFTTAMAASRNPGVVLLGSAPANPYLLAFLEAFKARQVIPIGSSLGDALRSGSTWQSREVSGVLKELFPAAETVVVSPAEPRRLLLQAACLAGSARAPLFVHRGTAADTKALQAVVAAWHAQQIYAVGHTNRLCRALPDVKIVAFKDEQAVFEAYLRRQARRGSIKTLVIANPADIDSGRGSMSTLAPWIALERYAALLLTSDAGTDAAAVVKTALKSEHLTRVNNLILVASLQAIPMEQRPNPVPGGKDVAIEMEPMTPSGREPASFATGRLFHEDRAVVPLMLARQRLLAEQSGPLRALVASNPGGGLPFLETFSRNTAQELHNAGYETTAFFGRQATREALHELLPSQTIFLWEGHHSTLVQDYRVHQWNEPLLPSLVFLQSCLALQEAKAQPFLQRGAVGVIGTSSRTYSGSGGAFSLAFFDALVYDQQTVGGALRSAKNFMLAFAQLKEQRLGAKMQLGGANLRAAWAFSLWGDPTLKLPHGTPPEGALAPVRPRIHGNTISLLLPREKHEKVVSLKYQTEMRPNARLAGLLTKQEQAEAHRLVPLVFAEVRLPAGPDGKKPRLHSTLPASRWVFCYDQRRGCGYLLAMPRLTDEDELRFHLHWE